MLDQLSMMPFVTAGIRSTRVNEDDSKVSNVVYDGDETFEVHSMTDALNPRSQAEPQLRPTGTQPATVITARALQLGESLDTKGLERDDAFSTNPLAFKTASGGTVMLFKSGASVFFAMNPVEEEDLIGGLTARIKGAVEPREIETAQISVREHDDDSVTLAGIQVKAADQKRLLLIGEALAVSVALAYDERRMTKAFERIEPVAASLINRKLPPGPQAALLEQIGEALLIQQRLAGRVDLDEKPDVLWDHPELERFWAKLVDEYDLPSRARAIERKLVVIRESADTITDLISTRTSHRLEWYIIALIGLEIGMQLYDRLWRL
jgi:uncharacterized Rmd1/YagE family protein